MRPALHVNRRLGPDRGLRQSHLYMMLAGISLWVHLRRQRRCDHDVCLPRALHKSKQDGPILQSRSSARHHAAVAANGH